LDQQSLTVLNDLYTMSAIVVASCNKKGRSSSLRFPSQTRGRGDKSYYEWFKESLQPGIKTLRYR